MKQLVSIIVPIYNVEKYLVKCVDSIINQTYKNIEILLINDGSTDNSGKICDEIAKKDNRIKVFHKKNGGLSDARNYGISKSKGEYLSFIDSDDYIDDDMIEQLYYGCINNNIDIASCAKYLEDVNGKYKIINKIKNKTQFGREQALKMIFLSQNIDTSACDKLFKKTLFENVKFPDGKYYEDLGTIYKIVDISNGIYHIGFPKYHYINRTGSITKSKFNIKHLDSLFFSEEICKYYKNKNKEIYECANALYYLTLNDILQSLYTKKAIKDNKEIYIKIRKDYKKNILNMLKCKYISKLKKIMIIAVYLKLYFVVNFIKKLKSNLRKEH